MKNRPNGKSRLNWLWVSGMAGLLLFAAFVASVTFPGDAKPIPNTPINPTLAESAHTAWTQVTNIALCRPGFRKPINVTGRIAVYQFGDRSRPQYYRATAFVSPISEKLWFGPEQDFYVETSSGPVGCRRSSSLLVWFTGFGPKDGSACTNLDAAIRTIETKVDFAGLEAAFIGGVDEATRRRRVTNLATIPFSPWAFTDGDGSAQDSPTLRTEGFEMDGGMLKLTITNPASCFGGTVWIDPQTKRFVRAMENGKVVFNSPRK